MTVHPALLLALGCATFALSACGAVETRITSAGEGVREKAVLTWAPVPEEWNDDPARTNAHRAARAALTDILTRQGFRFADDGTVLVSVGLAQRAASTQIMIGEGKLVSPPRNRHLFQPCGKNMLRLTVSMADAANGTPLYTGSAQRAHCDTDIEQITILLAQEATEDIASPAGERLIRVRTH